VRRTPIALQVVNAIPGPCCALFFYLTATACCKIDEAPDPRCTYPLGAPEFVGGEIRHQHVRVGDIALSFIQQLCRALLLDRITLRVQDNDVQLEF
jgi:hypothetical protein